MMTNIIITMNLSLSAHVMPLLNHADPVLPTYDRFIPAQTESGDRIPKAPYFSQLYVSTAVQNNDKLTVSYLSIGKPSRIKMRQPLLDACTHFSICHAKRDIVLGSYESYL